MIDLSYMPEIIESLSNIMLSDELFPQAQLTEAQEGRVIHLLSGRVNGEIRATAELVLQEMLEYRTVGVNTGYLVTQIRDVLNRYSS